MVTHPQIRLLVGIALLAVVLSTSPATSRAEETMDTSTPVVFYDMTRLFERDLKDPAQRRAFWDETHLVTSLQGIVNREEPRLFIRYNAGPDDFWWERVTEQGGWLEGRAVERIETLEVLLARFSDDYDGAVMWDERVPATSNLASTIAGCEDLLCLRYDEDAGSLCQRLAEVIPVKKRLMAENGGPLFTGTGTVPGTAVPSSGSAKCDAYLWLTEHYIKTGKANPHCMGNYLDGYWLEIWDQGAPQNHTLTNHDFVIARRGAFFDLNVWDDETPIDDPGQKPGTDADTLRTLLRAAYDQFGGDGVIYAAGFTPWAYKYTDYSKAGGKHGGVPTEWKYAEILSCFNAFMDADALGYSSMVNASFYQHFPLQEVMPQNPKPTRESLTKRGLLDKDGKIAPKRYVAHYVGDYDAAAWLYWNLPRVWMDEARGKVPLSWAFNPNLAERFPLGMAWTRATRTPNDFFIAGDSGAGYLNPGLLSEPRWHSKLPSGMAAWERHCRKYFEQWDLSVTGFVIDGNGPGLAEEGLDAYARFSPDGIVAQKIPEQGLHNGMPYLRMGGDLPGDPVEAARVIDGRFSHKPPQFMVFRSILKSPSYYAQISRELAKVAGDDAVVVDMYTLFWLLREYESQPDRHAPPPSEFADATSVSARPRELEGLRAVYFTDGSFSIEEVEGVTAWHVAKHDPGQYLYFAVDDDFSKSACPAVEVSIEFLDVGEGEILLQYDSSDRGATFGGVYKDATPIARTNTGKWRTEAIRLPDARFGNGQNGGSDFRFYNGGDDLCVREVRIRRSGGNEECKMTN
jgi:GxGYxYP putative glycoside hydrolase C-terminal domain/GxGYxYP_N 1st domain